jgi:hypothetical protein
MGVVRRTAHWDGGLAAGDRIAQGMHASSSTRIPRLALRKIFGYSKEDMDCIF